MNKNIKLRTKSISLQKAFILITLIIALVYLSYRTTLNNEFVNWDDNLYVYENPYIRSLNPENVLHMFTTFHAANWHPVTWISHTIDYQLFGLNPKPHHMVNIILHCLNTVWVFLLVITICLIARKNKPILQQKIIKRGNLPLIHIDTSIFITAGIAALLFGLHPQHVESVAWISERKDLLCAFFIIPAYLFYLLYSNTLNKRLHNIYYITILILFIFALMSKPMAVTAPIVFLLLDIFPLKQLHFKDKSLIIKKISEKIPFFILSLLTGILTIAAQHKGSAIRSLTDINFSERLLNAINATIFYIEKFLWPISLVPFYPFPANISLSNPLFIFSLLLLILITIFCIHRAYFNQTYWLVAWSYYLITLLPVLGIMQVGIQGAADRYTYLPTLSFMILAGVAISWSWEYISFKRFKILTKIIISGLILFVMISLSLLTTQQCKIWKNSITLWEYVLTMFPEKVYIGHNNLALAYSGNGKIQKAILECKNALKINPDYFDAHNNLGTYYVKEKMYDEAISEFKKTIEINPNHPGVLNNLGNTYWKKGLYNDAIQAFKTALKIAPNSPGLWNILGDVYNEINNFNMAVKSYRIALSINPSFLESYYGLANLYIKNAFWDEAIEAYQNSLKIKPVYIIWNNLGNIYYKKGEINKAISSYQESIKLKPDFGLAFYNLGFIYMQNEEFNKAIFYLKKSLSLQPNIIDAYYDICCIYSIQNKEDEAILWLKKTIKAGFNDWELLKTNKYLKNIRHTPYYKELIKNH